MTKVSSRQYAAYMVLWERTGHGTRTWTGVLMLDGTPLTRLHELINSLRKKGLIDWRRIASSREFKCLADPTTLEVHNRHPNPRQMAEQRHEQSRIRDEGRFIEAARKARLPLFEDEPNLKSALTPYIPPRHRPDARVLAVVRASSRLGRQGRCTGRKSGCATNSVSLAG